MLPLLLLSAATAGLLGDPVEPDGSRGSLELQGRLGERLLLDYDCPGGHCEAVQQATDLALGLDLRPLPWLGLSGSLGRRWETVEAAGYGGGSGVLLGAGLGLGLPVSSGLALGVAGRWEHARCEREAPAGTTGPDQPAESSSRHLEAAALLSLSPDQWESALYLGPLWTRDDTLLQLHTDELNLHLIEFYPVGGLLGARLEWGPLGNPWSRSRLRLAGELRWLEGLSLDVGLGATF